MSAMWIGFTWRSWVVISRVIRPLIGLITIVTLLMTSLVTTHEPPSTVGFFQAEEMKAYASRLE